MSENIPKERSVYRRSLGAPPYRLEKHTERLPSPIPPTSILVRVYAVSLNYRDANILNGTNPWPVIEGGIVASDAAGEVIAVGSHAQRFKTGDKVCPILDQNSITGEEQKRIWLSADVDGTLATHLIMDEQLWVRFPEHLSWAEAACLTNAGVTAWSALASEGRRLVAGQTVLLQGTGGVSMMAMKLALAAGCKIILTSSSDDKLAGILKTTKGWPISTINYKSTPDWEKEALRLNDGVGADIILENGGTPSTIQSLKAVKKGGIVSQVGYLGKQDPAHLDGLISLLIDKTVNFRGINVGSRQDFEQMNKFINASKIYFEDIIDRRFKFEETDKAFEYLWSGKHVGKIVIEL